MGNPAELKIDGDAEGQIVALIRRAEGGDAKALAKVRDLARTHLASIWDTYGNLADVAERGLIEAAAGENALMREAIQAKVADLRRELEGENPSPLERLLVEQVVICWLHLNYRNAVAGRALKDRCSLLIAEHQGRLGERAQRRFESAVKTLVTVRRLALPTVQVNIAASGGRQVNVGTLGTPGALGAGDDS